jgi:HEAT repeat protein
MARPARPRRPTRRVSAYLGRPGRYWVGVLASDDPLRRRLAAHALAEIGPGAPRGAAQALRGALRDAEPFVRVWAAAALARVEPRSASSLATLLEAAQAPAAFVRSLSAWHLGRVGVHLPDVTAALPRLASLLEDPDANVRAEAGLALRALQARGTRPSQG